MTRFKFCLVGSPQAPILELPMVDVSELHVALARSKYVEGRMVEIDGHETDCPVLIPTSRILMVMDASADC